MSTRRHPLCRRIRKIFPEFQAYADTRGALITPTILISSRTIAALGYQDPLRRARRRARGRAQPGTDPDKHGRIRRYYTAAHSRRAGGARGAAPSSTTGATLESSRRGRVRANREPRAARQRPTSARTRARPCCSRPDTATKPRCASLVTRRSRLHRLSRAESEIGSSPTPLSGNAARSPRQIAPLACSWSSSRSTPAKAISRALAPVPRRRRAAASLHGDTGLPQSLERMGVPTSSRFGRCPAIRRCATRLRQRRRRRIPPSYSRSRRAPHPTITDRRRCGPGRSLIRIPRRVAGRRVRRGDELVAAGNSTIEGGRGQHRTVATSPTSDAVFGQSDLTASVPCARSNNPDGGCPTTSPWWVRRMREAALPCRRND